MMVDPELSPEEGDWEEVTAEQLEAIAREYPDHAETIHRATAALASSSAGQEAETPVPTAAGAALLQPPTPLTGEPPEEYYRRALETAGAALLQPPTPLTGEPPEEYYRRALAWMVQLGKHAQGDPAAARATSTDQLPLPGEDETMSGGKFDGQSFRNIMDERPRYILWLLANLAKTTNPDCRKLYNLALQKFQVLRLTERGPRQLVRRSDRIIVCGDLEGTRVPETFMTPPPVQEPMSVSAVQMAPPTRRRTRKSAPEAAACTTPGGGPVGER